MEVFERYNGILCIRADVLIREFINKSLYDYYLNKKKINRIRRACFETPALIEVASLPGRLLNALKEKYGNDLEGTSEKNTLRGFYTINQEALDFYRTYIGSSGMLSERKQVEYTINASVLIAVREYYNWRATYIKTKGGSIGGLWKQISDYVNDLKKGPTPINHTLPGNYRRLKSKLDEFGNNNFAKLISGKIGNKNTEKLGYGAQMWVLQRWCDQVNKVPGTTELLIEYNRVAEKQGWEKLKSGQTLLNYLNRPEIYKIWCANRYGELFYKEKFCYKHRTLLPTMRDSLWYSDGTKLNFYYQYTDKEGRFKVGTKQVYEVMDAYSEVFLGYHISDSENFEAQFRAYKMAFNFSKHKPYQITYDNQGGHKKGEAGDLFNKLAHLNIKTQPYNGKSKTIESAFGRFQQHIMKKKWFFTGQNITAGKDESRANMEFILANTHNLPTLEEAIAAYQECRNEWNNAAHYKTGKSRLEMYLGSENSKTTHLGLMDIVDLFYVTRPEPVTCTADGILIREKKEKLYYMVTLEDNLPDVEWLQNNIDKKFFVKYDPENLDIIFLYEKTHDGLRYVAPAQTKVVIHRGKQEQEAWEAQWYTSVNNMVKEMRVKTMQERLNLQKKYGTSADDYGLITPAIKGIQTSRAAKQKVKKKELIPAGVESMGTYTKRMSNMDRLEDDEEFDAVEYLKRNG